MIVGGGTGSLPDPITEHAQSKKIKSDDDKTAKEVLTGWTIIFESTLEEKNIFEVR
jgi:hypothetical protein